MRREEKILFDPWKTFRLVIKNENSVDITDAYDLLTDADALLVVVNGRLLDARRTFAEEFELNEGNVQFSWWLEQKYPDLAALPKHLTHEHEWVDPTNEYVSGGAICLDCGDIRAETPEQLKE